MLRLAEEGTHVFGKKLEPKDFSVDPRLCLNMPRFVQIELIKTAGAAIGLWGEYKSPLFIVLQHIAIANSKLATDKNELVEAAKRARAVRRVRAISKDVEADYPRLYNYFKEYPLEVVYNALSEMREYTEAFDYKSFIYEVLGCPLKRDPTVSYIDDESYMYAQAYIAGPGADHVYGSAGSMYTEMIETLLASIILGPQWAKRWMQDDD